ncbi:beta-class carbonic anhydrase [Pseudogracilibacillus auburnensis]|uniref:carbonic anhydrase n=1 Tax=Pseudogracilibacillus auburnensis TaxID=1494959 RepID=A0A2V3W403_9BACI|nr:carbonic anhydrase [Pseudogracilibacillus auburnensis]MBO1002890.1 carbonic anhydrase [Pseudogracilibacillus auburnensis]PXW86985.1 carbonic anhydrase [Pseudogracilibacillus auburnensis]
MQIEEMLEYNKKFVADKNYEQFLSNTIPNKKMVVFTCMESRLVELLPKALNIQNGDVKMVKNAGAIIRKSFDSIIKSILVAIYKLQAEEVVVIGHHDCGMSCVDTHDLKDKMKAEGITDETFKALEYSGIDFHKEFHGFNTVEESIAQSVEIIREHPLLPSHVLVHGLVIDPNTGKVDVISLDKKEKTEKN